MTCLLKVLLTGVLVVAVAEQAKRNPLAVAILASIPQEPVPALTATPESALRVIREIALS
ncbi:hypothetical protein [Halopseudomonas oceani]|uniref:hypothetical protein n=1 Tax=Halopseudomonas oceani TaxID=1708783 RepID=UPI002AA92F0E|nr:hypothetical protein [Halopseudomonas oceani]